MNLRMCVGPVLAIVFIGPVTAWASSCAGSGPPCEMAWKADVVFAGTVLSIIEPPVPTVTGGSSIGRQLRSTAPQPTPFHDDWTDDSLVDRSFGVLTNSYIDYLALTLPVSA
jgi:hypothetical protein